MTNKLTAQRIVARFHRESMANLRPEETGIKGAILWISSGEFSGTKIKHGPRLKVMEGTKLTADVLKKAVTVKLTDPPEIIGSLSGKLKTQVIKFVTENHDTLISYWRFEINISTLLKQLKRV